MVMVYFCYLPLGSSFKVKWLPFVVKSLELLFNNLPKCCQLKETDKYVWTVVRANIIAIFLPVNNCPFV